MNNYGEWKESKKEYKRMKRQERNKRQAKLFLIIFLCLIPLSIVMVVNKQLNPTTTDQASADAEFDPSKYDMRPLLESYDSKVPFKVIFKAPPYGYYYVQQTKGKVTTQSVDEIIKELYAKELFAQVGGKLWGVDIFDNSVVLEEGVRPPEAAESKAKYNSRSEDITIYLENNKTKTTPFEPARKE